MGTIDPSHARILAALRSATVKLLLDELAASMNPSETNL